MDDSKTAALMFLILGAFLLWLHAQGKLIPLFQQLFGLGLYGQKAAAASSAAPAPSPTTSPTLNLGTSPSLLTILTGIAGVATGKYPASTLPAIPSTPGINPGVGNPGPLPNFPGAGL